MTEKVLQLLQTRIQNIQATLEEDKKAFMKQQPTANDVGDANCVLASMHGKMELCEELLVDLGGGGNSIVMEVLLSIASQEN